MNARQVAYEYLRVADRTTQELRSRLLKAGVPLEEADALVEEMLRRKFVSDDRVAEREGELAKSVRRTGREKLRARLDARGVDEGAAERSMESYSETEEAANALEFLRMKQPDSVAKAARMLVSRGFSEESVRSALEGHFPDWEG